MDKNFIPGVKRIELSQKMENNFRQFDILLGYKLNKKGQFDWRNGIGKYKELREKYNEMRKAKSVYADTWEEDINELKERLKMIESEGIMKKALRKIFKLSFNYDKARRKFHNTPQKDKGSLL